MNPDKEQSARELAEQTRRALLAYHLMAQTFRPIARLPLAQIRATLSAAGKTAVDLVEDILAGEGVDPQPGDPCDCGGQAVVYRSRPRGQWRRQYLRCRECGAKMGRRTIPEEAVRRRRSRKGKGKKEGLA